MTADPSPEPMVMSVAGLAVARNTLPASKEDAAVLPAPSSGSSQALSMTPPDWNGRAVDQDARNASLASLPRSTNAILECPSYVSTCPTGSRGTSCRGPAISTVFFYCLVTNRIRGNPTS